MFLVDEIVREPQLLSSVCLYGIEAILTIVMLIYISKYDIFHAAKENIYLNAMLAASKVQ